MEKEQEKKDIIGGPPDVGVEGEDIVFDEEEGDCAKIIKKLKDKLHYCELEKQQNLEGWQRARADYVNARKAEEKNLLELEPMIKQRILSEMLPVADNFEIAFSHKESWEKIDKNWRVGIESIYSQLLEIFSSFGLIRFGKVGENFNPEEYQAIGTIDVLDKEEDSVVKEVVQSGYRYRDKVLRPSKVRVGVFHKE